MNAAIRAGLLALILAGCGGDKLAQLDARLETQGEELAALESRLETLEHVPQLSFVLSDYQLDIEEQMFQPQLKSRARLRAVGDTIPHTFYVDMMLRVEVPAEEFIAVNRQVFPVFDGKSQIELMQALPVHGLGKKDVKVTLRPMNWYGSHRIPEERVSYHK